MRIATETLAMFVASFLLVFGLVGFIEQVGHILGAVH